MSRHNKRYDAPTEKWGIPTKEFFWAPKEEPGPHPSDRSVPLKVILRDILEYSNTSREAKKVLADRKIKVDGKIVTDGERPTGLMDVVSMEDLDEDYRILFDQRGRIRLIPIDGSQAEWKLAKIEDKTSLKDGITQYNFHDGRNIRSKDEDKFGTNDVLKIQLPSQEPLESYEFKEGMMALVTGGKHIGEIGTIEEIEVIRGPQPNFVHFESGISTIEKYAFVIGKDTPTIEIPEVGIV
ncbi:MAG: 30S ribosomal protein S4e [Candidatus Thermoplasmatota archaeon]|nr:30S ribosomal protein S4e [Candidatus Thermoplasmatota archaeon]